MSVAEAQVESAIVFKTDEEVLSYSLNEFKKEQCIFLQEVVDVDGGFAFGKRRFFQHRDDMTPMALGCSRKSEICGRHDE